MTKRVEIRKFSMKIAAAKESMLSTILEKTPKIICFERIRIIQQRKTLWNKHNLL